MSAAQQHMFPRCVMPQSVGMYFTPISGRLPHLIYYESMTMTQAINTHTANK